MTWSITHGTWDSLTEVAHWMQTDWQKKRCPHSLCMRSDLFAVQSILGKKVAECSRVLIIIYLSVFLSDCSCLQSNHILHWHSPEEELLFVFSLYVHGQSQFLTWFANVFPIDLTLVTVLIETLPNNYLCPKRETLVKVTQSLFTFGINISRRGSSSCVLGLNRSGGFLDSL